MTVEMRDIKRVYTVTVFGRIFTDNNGVQRHIEEIDKKMLEFELDFNEKYLLRMHVVQEKCD
jgi:hypothetical protein